MLNKLERCYSHYSISQTTKRIKTFVECLIHMLSESTDCFSSSRLVFCCWVGLISSDLTFFFLEIKPGVKFLETGINVTNFLIVATFLNVDFELCFFDEM